MHTKRTFRSPRGAARALPAVPLAVALIVATALSGCGSAKYEERLARTAEFYDYLHTVDSNLAAPAWDRRDLGMVMRVPREFAQPLPGPEVTETEEGERVTGPDPRHPEVLGIELPGLEEAWAKLPGETEEPVDARIYVLTNHDRLRNREERGPSPSEFFTDLERILMNAFQVSIPEGEAAQPGDNVRFRHTVPSRGSVHARYTTPKDYAAIRFVPEAGVNGAAIQGLLFKREAGDVQAAVLVIGPQALAPKDRQRLDLALQTLQITPLAPARPGETRPGPSRRPAGPQF